MGRALRIHSLLIPGVIRDEEMKENSLGERCFNSFLKES
jgi:hypothetical protein